MWHLNDDEAVPPLPATVFPQSEEGQSSSATSSPLLKPGCWIVQVAPFFSDDLDPRLAEAPTLHGWTVRYLGTMRVESAKQKNQGWGIVASGDLYVQREPWSDPGKGSPPDLPCESSIPIFPRLDYSFYFTVDKVNIGSSELILNLATYRFDPNKFVWGPRAEITARLRAEIVPAHWQERSFVRYFCGVIRNDRGSIVAKLEMGWVSKFLRRAEVGIAVAAGLKVPLNDGKDLTLKKAFKRVGWKLKVAKPIPAQGPVDLWPEKDLHAKMLALRSAANLDREWLYHVLVVPRFRDDKYVSFGKMYDRDALDTNMIPREGLVVATEARFPAEARFGTASGERLSDVVVAAFHNLVHELGHAMGLLHRYRGVDFMQSLFHIASQASPGSPFPDNIACKFDPQDKLRLGHLPDPWVRPGGAPFSQGYLSLSVPESDAISDVGRQFQLFAAPLRPAYPLGSPVKIQLRLKNIDSNDLPGPSVLSLAEGSVIGRVIGLDGVARSFSAAAPLDFVTTAMLKAGESLFHGESLWRGPDGPLFPSPGSYRIEVDSGWVGPSGIARTTTYCSVQVTAPRSRRHERMAFKLLGEEDLAILLIFRSSSDFEDDESRARIERAQSLLLKAMKIKAFRSTLAFIEILRLATSDLMGAASLVKDRTLFTSSDIEYLLKQIQQNGDKFGPSSGMMKILKICKKKIEKLMLTELAPESLRSLVDELLNKLSGIRAAR